MSIQLIRASMKDAETIWRMQQEAFAFLLERYQDYDTNPASEPLEKVQRRIASEGTHFYFIAAGGVPVGAIRVVDKGDGSVKRISPLFILPRYQGRGFAQSAIRETERLHGKTGWQLDTILQEKGNCHLYEKLGYRQTGKARVINPRMTLVDYEK